MERESERIPHEQRDREPIVVLNPPKMPGSGPPCIFDEGPTQKTGSCYTCLLCGATTSCG